MPTISKSRQHSDSPDPSSGCLTQALPCAALSTDLARPENHAYSDDPAARVILRSVAPEFTAHYSDEGIIQEITVDALPPCIKVNDEFLEYLIARDAVFSFVGGDESRLRIETANASCTYRRVDHDFARCQTVWLAEGG